MPTSVLLAVLAAAGLFALAPALVRRYDATERLTAERTSSTARVLSRQRRRRTVPGSAPVNPPRPTVAAWQTHDTRRPSGPVPSRHPAALTPQGTAAWGRARRRRVLTVLTLLVATEVTGVILFGPGFWVGLGLSAVILVGYVAMLRTIVRDERRRRAAEREAAARARRAARPTPSRVTRLAPTPPPAAPTFSNPDEDEASPPPRAANL